MNALMPLGGTLFLFVSNTQAKHKIKMQQQYFLPRTRNEKKAFVLFIEDEFGGRTRRIKKTETFRKWWKILRPYEWLCACDKWFQYILVFMRHYNILLLNLFSVALERESTGRREICIEKCVCVWHKFAAALDFGWAKPAKWNAAICRKIVRECEWKKKKKTNINIIFHCELHRV